ncbi:terminase small subunit [Enterobacter hormaechei]|uniref:terminase small subunit n=1 Tax=Enterobacter hormaechei TaxID=158836 RepID=UPI003890725D
MEVNKKRLSEIFGVSIRTIQNWQDQGMPVARGGGKGNEVLYDSAAVIEWYSARDAAIENEKLRKEVEQLRVDSESDLLPGTIDYERHRLTRAQADAQELKNAKESAEVVETAFCTFVLSRIAGEIASILDGSRPTNYAAASQRKLFVQPSGAAKGSGRAKGDVRG